MLTGRACSNVHNGDRVLGEGEDKVRPGRRQAGARKLVLGGRSLLLP